MGKIEIVALEGPLQGERIDLPESGSLIFGRSRRGVQLQDAQVSMEHAEITRTGGRFAITDLGSISGTFVNGRKLGRESASVSVGTTIKIGDSLFRVEEPVQSRSWVAGLLVALVFILGVVGWAAMQLAAPVTYDPTLVWSEPVAQGGGKLDASIPIPLAFIRTEGLDDTNVAIHRVSDFDEDGAGELWLITPNEELVVRMDGGTWTIVGRLPKGCLDRSSGYGYPELNCDNGDVWVFRNGRYRLGLSGGTTVWVDWQPPADASGAVPAKAVAPLPFRVGFTDEQKLTGFLQARGVEEPVHYLICEGFLPGLAAQVLTDAGTIEPLDYGCIKELGFAGNGKLSGDTPLAVAFTGAGRIALVNDLREYLSGSPDGLFLDDGQRAWIDVLNSEAVQQLTQRVTFTGAELPGSPVPLEFGIDERHTLLAGSGGKAAPRAEVVTVTESSAIIDPPGCSELEVDVKDWHCVLTKACTPSSTVVTVLQKGCGTPGPIAKVPFTGGVVAGGDASVELRVAVDSHGGSGRVDVLRTRVGWREVPPPEPTEEVAP